MNKYNNRRVVCDGITFDSLAEHRRYLQLKQMRADGLITNLVAHPTYTVVKPFVDSDGVKQTGIKYTPDFQYEQDGQCYVEDVKGYPSRDFSMRAKLFKLAYPTIKLRIIKV